MTRFRFTNVERRGIRAAYKAEIEVDGRTIGFVQKAAHGNAHFRAQIDGKVVASAPNLADLRADLREYFAAEYQDAKESW